MVKSILKKIWKVVTSEAFVIFAFALDFVLTIFFMWS